MAATHRVTCSWAVTVRRLSAGCVAAFLAVCLPPDAVGQLRFSPVPHDTAYIAYERDVADVNGDRLNDVVCVSEDEAVIRAFLAPNWQKIALIEPAGEFTWPRADDLKAHDLDGDGDADIVARLGPARNSDAPGVAVWFENRGKRGWRQTLIGPSSGYVKDICVADLDQDDRPDVVMRQDGETQIYFQEQAGWTTVNIAHAPHEGMEVADLDGDGRPDLIMNGFWFATPATSADARVATNYQALTVDDAWFQQTGDWTANSCKVVAGDFDGDGRSDVAFAQSERADHAVTWYRSPTPRVAGSWTRHPVAAVDFCHNLQAADWDADGDTDLLVGGMVQSQHRGLKFLLNSGQGTNWQELPLQTDGSYSAEVGDIDNDDDLDIVGVRNWNSPPSFIYRNESHGGRRSNGSNKRR